MPRYLYSCQCGNTDERYLPFILARVAKVQCTYCHLIMEKVLSVNFKRPMQAGYSPTTGQYISNERDLSDQLKVASEAATLRTGIPHNFTPIDMRDRAQTGQTDEGLDATMARQVADGEREVKKWL